MPEGSVTVQITVQGSASVPVPVTVPVPKDEVSHCRVKLQAEPGIPTEIPSYQAIIPPSAGI